MQDASPAAVKRSESVRIRQGGDDLACVVCQATSREPDTDDPEAELGPTLADPEHFDDDEVSKASAYVLLPLWCGQDSEQAEGEAPENVKAHFAKPLPRLKPLSCKQSSSEQCFNEAPKASRGATLRAARAQAQAPPRTRQAPRCAVQAPLRKAEEDSWPKPLEAPTTAKASY